LERADYAARNVVLVVRSQLDLAASSTNSTFSKGKFREQNDTLSRFVF